MEDPRWSSIKRLCQSNGDCLCLIEMLLWTLALVVVALAGQTVVGVKIHHEQVHVSLGSKCFIHSFITELGPLMRLIDS